MAGLDLQSRSVPVALKKSNGGLNSTASALNVADNESSDLQNIDFDKFGSILKRSGYATLNSSAYNSGAAWNSLHWLELSSGTSYLIGSCGNKVAKMDDLDGTWDDITGNSTVTFTGSGLNDATSGGTYTGSGDIVYKVEIDGTGTPDTFKWYKDAVLQASTVNITGSAQTLDNGLTITFAATTGHTSTDYWSFRPATVITAGNTNYMAWTTFLDTAIGTNNVDRPIAWTGSGNATLSKVPSGLTKAKFVTVFNGYLHYTNVTVSGTSHKSRTYWGAQDSISSFDSASFRDLNKNDGQTITGVRVLGDKQVFFKERCVWVEQFTGDADIPFVFTRTPSTVGCIDGNSIQEVDNGLIFLSGDGYYYFDGVNSIKLSDRITTTLTTVLEPSRFPYSQSCYQKSKNRYWGSHTLAAGSTHSRIITFDSYNNAWSYYKGHNANCFAIVNTNGQERVYFGDYSGYVYRADTGTNDNPAGVETAINAYYKTKWFDFDDLVSKKGVPECVIYFQIANATHTFSYSWNFEDGDQYSLTVPASTSSSVYGTALYDIGTYAASGGDLTRKDLTGRGRVIRLKFANANLGETMQIDGFGLLPHLESVT